MTTGILYVLHGRRGKVSTANLDLLTQLQHTYPNLQRTCFLEGDIQTLEDSLLTLQEQVTQILVVPILLFPATHVRWDLPRRIQAVARADLQLTYLQPLATTQAIYQFLQTQLAQALQQYPQRQILLVAHGTPHFSEPGKQLQALAQQLQTSLHAPVLWAHFKGRPQLDQVLAQQTQPLIVQRLFLTEGRIAGELQNRIAAQLPDSVFLPTLENQPALSQAIAERLAPYLPANAAQHFA